MAQEDERTICRTPTKGRSGITRIPNWKFDCLRAAIRNAVGEAGDNGLLFSELPQAVSERLNKDEKAKLGSLGWHVTTVKLELEVRGELTRLQGSPQRLALSN